jgi:hypothetical protein
MKYQCAWCGKDLGPGQGQPLAVEQVSHGICHLCAEVVLAQLLPEKAPLPKPLAEPATRAA